MFKDDNIITIILHLGKFLESILNLGKIQDR